MRWMESKLFGNLSGGSWRRSTCCAAGGLEIGQRAQAFTGGAPVNSGGVDGETGRRCHGELETVFLGGNDGSIEDVRRLFPEVLQ
jgi:hypothetical protein